MEIPSVVDCNIILNILLPFIYHYIPTVTWLAVLLSLASGLATWFVLSCGIWVEVVMEVSRGLQGHYALFLLLQDWYISNRAFMPDPATKKPCGAEPQPSYNTGEITLCSKPLSLCRLLLGPNLVRLTHSLMREILHPWKALRTVPVT